MNYRGFIGPSAQSQAYTFDQERTVNWFPEKAESAGATSRVMLAPTPGVERITTAPQKQGRANEFYSGRQFMVVGNILFEMDSDGATTFRHTVSIDSNPATISWNGDGGDEIFVTSGGNGYTMNLTTNTVTQITALNGKATMGAAIDGYFLALDANTGTFYASDLLDGLTWTTGTMFAQRISAPDPWIGMTVFGKYIWLFGSQTSEVWFNNGASPFPFAQYPGSLIPYGVASAWSSKVVGSSIMWLAASKEGQGQVMRASGFTPENVASYAVQFAISQYETLSDAYADSYSEAGHTFYVLSFPTENVATHVYDLEMSAWHERGSWDPSRIVGEYGPWRLICHALAFGEHRWLDLTEGHVYRSALDIYTDASQNEYENQDPLPIRRLRRAPAIVSELNRIHYPGLELDIEPATGLVTGQGEDPQVMMRYSNDGGKTWSREEMRSTGKVGEYAKRVRWLRLGSGRRRVFEVSMSDPVASRVTNAYLIGFPDQRVA